MRSAHTQLCHEPKACTSPAKALCFPLQTVKQGASGPAGRLAAICFTLREAFWSEFHGIPPREPPVPFEVTPVTKRRKQTRGKQARAVMPRRPCWRGCTKLFFIKS